MSWHFVKIAVPMLLVSVFDLSCSTHRSPATSKDPARRTIRRASLDSDMDRVPDHRDRCPLDPEDLG